MSNTTSFPIGSNVLLHSLVSGNQYNGKKGTVKAMLDPTSLRQAVYVIGETTDVSKTIAIKPANMRFVPRDPSSLTSEEAMDLICHSESKSEMEVHTMALLQMSNANASDSQKIVRDEISACPAKIAELLAGISFEHDAFADTSKAGKRDGWTQGGAPPLEYIKTKYRKSNKRDKEEDAKLSCKTCGKYNTKLAKCGKCLSVYYCNAYCQKEDFKRHQKECMQLKAQRHSEVQNEVDRAGRPNIPYVGLALSESITGVPGEVLCEFPIWTFESAGEIMLLNTQNHLYKRDIAKAIRYFFKTYQSSTESAKSLSLDDKSGLCYDAAILYWLKCPGVRRVHAHEIVLGQDDFVYRYCTLSGPPKNWKLKDEDVAHLSSEIILTMKENIEQMRKNTRFPDYDN